MEKEHKDDELQTAFLSRNGRLDWPLHWERLFRLYLARHLYLFDTLFSFLVLVVFGFVSSSSKDWYHVGIGIRYVDGFELRGYLCLLFSVYLLSRNPSIGIREVLPYLTLPYLRYLVEECLYYTK